MSTKATLDDYPALARWYAEERGCSAPAVAHRLVLGTCEALARIGAVDPGRSPAELWSRNFRAFLDASLDPLADFLKAEALMQQHDAVMLDLIGDFGERSLRQGDSTEFFEGMRQGADRTGLVAFRFMSAWTALNSGRPAVCAEECEKVDEPFSSIHTLHGQALLELGRPQDALETLEVATKLAPQEILAWFQKAKALHLLGRHDAAISALRHCQALAPQSDEVALYMGMIAAESTSQELWLEGFSALRPRLARLPEAPVSLTLLKLAALLKDKGKALAVLRDGAWQGRLSTGDAIQSLATILRIFGELGWMDVSAHLLGKVTQEVAS